MRRRPTAGVSPTDGFISWTRAWVASRSGIGAALFALVLLALSGPGFGAAPAKVPAPIDVNSASPAQLKTLEGVGDAEARRIVAGRPYHSKADLVTRNVIPAGIYQSIRHRIIAIQPGTPRAGRHP